jgi:hypothetical protein
MRAITIVLVIGCAVGAAAQEPPLKLTAPMPPPPPIVTLHAGPSPEVVEHWHDSRVVSVLGTVLNSIGTGLSLTSAIYIGIKNYPPSAKQLLAPQAKPSDFAPALAYAGASASAVGFALTAGALGYEHHLLDKLGADPGRAHYGAGTALGVVGFASVGLSYFFGLTDHLNPHDQSVAILTTSLTGTALCAIAGLLYAIDSSHVKRAWRELGNF